MKQIILFIAVFLTPWLFSAAVGAEDKSSSESEKLELEQLYNSSLDELVGLKTETKANVGSRSAAVDLLKAKVPVDVITAEQINSTGYTELSKVLQRFIAGFNFPRAAIVDGTDHIRPFTLRGMSPDQTLVLVNGKRLHASSLLNVNGTIGRGSTGVDLNTIALRSIERIEVLRDGAAAQYGSDAIAGIINIILKSSGQERRLTSTVGQTYAGDGTLYQTDVHYGVALPMEGFVDLTAEFRDRNPTNRAPVDSSQQYFNGDLRNNNPPQQRMRTGDPDTQDFLLALNSEMPLSDAIVFYLHGSGNYRQSEAGAFFRQAKDDRNVRALYPDGFLPLISPKIFDYSSTLGLKGETQFNLKWDFSHTVGGNQLDYHVKNSLNASLGTSSPTTFDAGGLGFRQHTTNLDLLKNLEVGLANPVKVAMGFEWRYETFQISAGEESSYSYGGIGVLDGPNAGKITVAGTQGFPGFRPDNALKKDRHNFAAYLDLDTQFNHRWSVGLAGRYEYYTDFGSTLNGKFAFGYQALDALLLRGSVSTGFRAPSLQQSFFNSTATANIAGQLTSTSTLSVDSPIAKALGATPLKAEQSQHITAGLVYKPTVNFSLSADYFYTQIENRIIFSRNITPTISAAVAKILTQGNLGAARFFTNALDTETQGIDLQANYKLDWQTLGELNLTGLYQYNQTKIHGGVRAPNILGTNGGNIIFSDVDRERLESGQPNESLILMANYKKGDFNSAVKLMRAGAFSESNRRLKSQWLADVDLAYQLYKNFNLAVGVHNLFNSNHQDSELTGNVGALVTTSPYGYDGGFYYLRLSADF